MPVLLCFGVYNLAVCHASIQVSPQKDGAARGGPACTFMVSGACLAMWAAAAAIWVGLHTFGGASTRYLYKSYEGMEENNYTNFSTRRKPKLLLS